MTKTRGQLEALSRSLGTAVRLVEREALTYPPSLRYPCYLIRKESVPPRGIAISASSTQETSGLRWAALVVVLSGSPAQTLLFAALGPILPMIASRFGAGGGGAFISQMVMTMPALGIILGGLGSGFVIERCGVRRVLYASLTAYAVLGSAGLYLDNSISLLASRFLLGIAVAHQSPCVVLLLAERYDEHARAKLLGYQGAVSGIASFTALVSAGVLAEWAGWRAPFAIYLLALPVLACAVIVGRLRRFRA